MPQTTFDREQRAVEGYSKFMTLAHEVRQYFQDADLPLPPALARMFGEVKDESTKRPVVVSSPKPPEKPLGAQEDWIWVHRNDLLAAGLVMTILHDSPKPMQAKEVAEKAQELQPHLVAGTIYNVGPRLEGTLIKRSDQGWELIDRAKAPILHGDFAWGPVENFIKQEVAAHRRLLIKHLLRTFPAGLMVMQIVEQLRDPQFCRVIFNKDLLKGDMEAMESDGLVKRKGGSRKWTLTDKGMLG